MADEYRYGPENKEPQGDPGPGRQGPNQQGYHYEYKYSYGQGRGTSSPNGNKPPQQNGDIGDWIAIAVLFMLPFGLGITQIIAIVWLVRKLISMDSRQKQRYKQEAQKAASAARDTVADLISRGRQAVDGQPRASGTGSYRYGQAAQPNQAKAQPKAEPWEAPDPREQKKRNRKHSKLMGGSGRGLVIGGGTLTGIFGLGALTVATVFLEELSYGFWEWTLLIPIAACLMFMGGGIAMLASGIGKGRRNERYLNYLAYIGANREVPLANMAAAFGVSVGKLCKDLRRMLAKGVLPTGYLDLAEGKLYLTEMGYRAPEPKQEVPPQETAQQAAAREDGILREIRQVNDSIPDAVMSAKIDRIEEITGKILKYQKEHPNKEGQLRSFLNYYLPTTLKILRAYAQLDAQGIEGENISAAKKRIEDMMDQVVYGFERQLDKLFRDDAMDITSDVEVLENMLRKDGLSDEGGITMTL